MTMQGSPLDAAEVKMSATGWRPHGPLGPDDRLHFLHIPKTAGRSVRAFLQTHFDWKDACPGTVLPDLYTMPTAEIEKWRLFCGHYGRYIHRLLSRPPVEITFLRDPIARSVSHYRDLKTREGTWLHEFVNTHTFDEFVLDPVTSTELMNLQTRFLALDDIDADYFGYSRQRDADLPGLTAKFTGEALYQRAQRNLDAMAFVGLQERFDESLALLAATFGWTPPRVAPRENTAKTPFDPSTISEQGMARLREITALDQRLYDRASARFAAIVDGMSPERYAAAYGQVMGARERLPELRLGFGRAFEGDGWHERERAPDGRVRRWTGPGESAWMDVPMDTSRPLRLRFRATGAALDVIQSVRVAVNGIETPISSWPLQLPENTTRVFDGAIPAETLAARREFTRIGFRVARTVCPAEEDAGARDRRRLGLCLEWLELFPAG